MNDMAVVKCNAFRKRRGYTKERMEETWTKRMSEKIALIKK